VASHHRMNGSRPPAGEPMPRLPHYDSLLHVCRCSRDTRMTLLRGTEGTVAPPVHRDKAAMNGAQILKTWGQSSGTVAGPPAFPRGPKPTVHFQCLTARLKSALSKLDLVRALLILFAVHCSLITDHCSLFPVVHCPPEARSRSPSAWTSAGLESATIT